MQIKSLKVFCDVARHRSFSQAATTNHITQSAVSQIVAQLEEDLDVQLIDRSTRPLQLTALGRTYYEGCQALLVQYDELTASLQSAQARIEGTVQVAAIYSVSLSDMNQYVRKFEAHEPNAKVQVAYVHPDQVYNKVLEGHADLGLVSFPRKSAKLTVMPWHDELMVLACPPQHPLARCRSITRQQLSGTPYVHFNKELTIRKEVDRFLREADVAAAVTAEFDTIENIKTAVECATGVAILPEPTLRQEIESKKLVAVPFADGRLVRPLGIIHRRTQKLSNAAQRFLELLRGGWDANGTPSASADPTPTTRPKASRASSPSRNGSHGPKKRSTNAK